MKNYALFSKNGRFIGFTNFKPTTGLYKEMPDNFDPVFQVYVGDYETGSLKDVSTLAASDYREANVDKKWKVLESDLNKEMGVLITETYNIPLYKQLNAIMKTLYENKHVLNLPKEFLDIYERIEDIRFNHNKSLESYKTAPKAEVIDVKNEQLFYEEYTQKQLNINDEPVNIEVIEQ